MFFTDIKRIFKTGFLNFWRNSVTSLAAILVFTITLFIIGSLILGSAVLSSSLNVLKEKVDINVYIEQETIEQDIISLKESLEALPEVTSVVYISREESLENFRERKKDDQIILQSLDELGENPLLAELRIRAQDPSQYEGISRFLEDEGALSTDNVRIINKVNYFDNQDVIQRFSEFINLLERMGIALAIVSIIIAVVVAFNTITLVIFNSRDEIGVMRLVGARDLYIRGPFMVEGIMFGVISTIITLLIMYPLTKWVSNVTNNFYGGIDLFDHFTSNFISIAGVILVSGLLIGIISGFLAVKRYLKL